MGTVCCATDEQSLRVPGQIRNSDGNRAGPESKRFDVGVCRRAQSYSCSSCAVTWGEWPIVRPGLISVTLALKFTLDKCSGLHNRIVVFFEWGASYPWKLSQKAQERSQQIWLRAGQVVIMLPTGQSLTWEKQSGFFKQFARRGIPFWNFLYWWCDVPCWFICSVYSGLPEQLLTNICKS